MDVPTQSELVDAVQREFRDVTPTISDFVDATAYSTTHIYAAIDSWNDVLRECGKQPNHSRDKTGKGEMVTELQRLAEELGETPSLTQMDEYGEFAGGTYYNYFDSWNGALKEAGLEPKHEYGNHVEKVCEVCGDEFEVIPSYSNKRFCGTACFAEHRRGNYTGQDHWAYVERVSVECYVCGDEKQVTPWMKDNRERHFCDIDCFKSVSGEDHWCWSDNPKDPIHWYGERWHIIRQEVIDSQDGMCRVCGDHETELERSLHVHHIKPIREFKEGDTIDWENANDKQNLCALCPSCHNKWEGMPVIAQHKK